MYGFIHTKLLTKTEFCKISHTTVLLAEIAILALNIQNKIYITSINNWFSLCKLILYIFINSEHGYFWNQSTIKYNLAINDK